jgi:uncharacterized cupin superfamily protein
MENIVDENQLEWQHLPGRDLKWLFTPEQKVSEAFSMNVVVIHPGCTVTPAHSHPEKEELVYIVGGEGKAFIDGSVYPIQAGTAILFPKRSVHMLRNSGTVDMKVVCIFMPQATMGDYAFHEQVVFPD